MPRELKRALLTTFALCLGLVAILFRWSEDFGETELVSVVAFALYSLIVLYARADLEGRL